MGTAFAPQALRTKVVTMSIVLIEPYFMRVIISFGQCTILSKILLFGQAGRAMLLCFIKRIGILTRLTLCKVDPYIWTG